MQRATSLTALALLLAALSGGQAHAEEHDHGMHGEGGDSRSFQGGSDRHGQGSGDSQRQSWGGHEGQPHQNQQGGSDSRGQGSSDGQRQSWGGHEGQPHQNQGQGQRHSTGAGSVQHQNRSYNSHSDGQLSHGQGSFHQDQHRNNFARSSQPLPQHFQRLGVQHMPAPLQRTQLLRADRAHSTLRWPDRGPRGEALNFHGAHINGPLVHSQLRAIATDRAVLNQIRGFNASERVAGRYYWHNYNGHNYCHYYDHWGFHWYGWYIGDSCFWVRQYHGGWWWHDPLRERWCYWYDGFWWWQNPDDTTVVYVYNGSDYVPSDPGVQGQAPAMSGAPTDNATAPTAIPSRVTPLPAAPGEIPSMPQDEGPQEQEEAPPAGASNNL